MTPLDLVYDCRIRLDDLGGDTGAVPGGYTYYWESDDAACLHKNAELIAFLNTAHRELALRTNCYRDALGGVAVTTYGANVLTTAGWTVGSGWVEATDDHFTHTSGTATLTHSASITTATAYRAIYTLSSVSAGSVTIAVGGISIAGITSSGVTDLTTASTAGLTVTPTTNFAGILVVTVQPITTPVSNPFALSVTAGTATYSLDTRILTVEDVRLASTNTSLTKWTLTDYRAAANQYTDTGTPTHYLEEPAPFRLTLYPIPTVNDTLYLTVYRYPLADFAWATRAVAVTEPTEFWREALIQGALMVAYQKRDADTGDSNRQKFHAMEFERLVGKSVDYRTLENRRYSANLDVSLRPKSYVPKIRGTLRWYENEDE